MWDGEIIIKLRKHRNLILHQIREMFFFLTICKDDCAAAAHDIKLFNRGPRHFAFILIFDLCRIKPRLYFGLCLSSNCLFIYNTDWCITLIVLLLVNKQNFIVDAESHGIMGVLIWLAITFLLTYFAFSLNVFYHYFDLMKVTP